MRTILIIVGLFLGAAAAQTDANHQVKIGIPSVLRLSLGNSESSSSANVPIRVEIVNGVSTLTPEKTELSILANSDWQLSASYQAASAEDAAAKLSWTMDGATGAFKAYPTILQTGQKTGGWKTLDVAYGLDNLPEDGIYEGVVTYTLARP